ILSYNETLITEKFQVEVTIVIRAGRRGGEGESKSIIIGLRGTIFFKKINPAGYISIAHISN
ncbi:hypothetical protein ALC56_01400, partial [Trachymyrmex septentrionalis]